MLVRAIPAVVVPGVAWTVSRVWVSNPGTVFCGGVIHGDVVRVGGERSERPD